MKAGALSEQTQTDPQNEGPKHGLPFSLRGGLDRVEQVAAFALYLMLVARLWPENFSPENLYPVLLLLSEGVVVFLLVIRRPTTQISIKTGDWVIAASGTFLALLVGRGGDPISLQAGAILMIIGMVIHIGAKLSLNRSFGLVAANRGVKASGMYKIVRHPMYAGYIISQFGFLFLEPSWRNLAIYIGVWTLLVARVFAEERMLLADPDYRAFAGRVRSRLIPGVF